MVLVETTGRAGTLVPSQQQHRVPDHLGCLWRLSTKYTVPPTDSVEEPPALAFQSDLGEGRLK